MLGPLSTAAILAAGAVYTAVRDPYQAGFFPECVFLAASGHYCPGCGGLRATHELLHGNLVGALDMNPVVVLVIIPLIVVSLAWWGLRSAGVRLPSVTISTPMAWALPLFLFAFWIARNIPALEPFLAP